MKVQCVLIYVTIWLGVESSSRHNQLALSQHVKRVQQYNCDNPQPRAIPLKELVKEDGINTATYILPFSTVLHRCEYSGYCAENVPNCVPVNTEEVELVFLLRDTKYNFRTVTVQNHTQCGCAPYTDNPK